MSDGGGGSNTGAIVGGVVGGVGGFLVLLALALFGYWLYRRKKRLNDGQVAYQHPTDDMSHVDPYSQPAYEETTAPPPPLKGNAAGVGAGSNHAGATVLAAAPASTLSAVPPAAPAAAPMRGRTVYEDAPNTLSDETEIPSSPSYAAPSPSRSATASPPRMRSMGQTAPSRPSAPNQAHMPVDASFWPSTYNDGWVSGQSPYAAAGVGHAYEGDQAPPPVAVHMRPGQIFHHASPVDAFSQPYGQPAGTRTSRVIRESLG